MDKELTIEQGVCAARIFLNIFGYVLEDCDSISEGYSVSIFDKNNEVVGRLKVNNRRVDIHVNDGNCMLNANYVLPKTSGFNDGGELFVQWSSDIAYILRENDDIKLSGTITIDNTMDTEFGIKCNCHPYVLCNKDDGESVGLKILRDGQTFGLLCASVDCSDMISIMPWDDLNGFIIHDVKNLIGVGGKYSSRKYTGVFKSTNSDDMLRTFVMEDKGGVSLYSNDNVKKVSTNENSSELLIQKGLLMQKIDPAMILKISELRDLLMVGDVSLFDNLVSVCFDSYTDEELKALLGVDRREFEYQDGSSNLIDSYYGVNNKNLFGISDKQKCFFKTKF